MVRMNVGSTSNGMGDPLLADQAGLECGAVLRVLAERLNGDVCRAAASPDGL